jgi:Mg-chelatase subunit ChlD
MTTTSTDLATTQSALDQLTKSASRSSLDDLVKARTRRSLLLVDCSGSMADTVRSGERRIDALRKVASDLRETHPVPMAAFGARCAGQVEVVDSVPEPAGGTPLDRAIDFGAAQGANHLVIVTDGQPDSEPAAFAAARTFGGQIDVFYIGDGEDRAARFCSELAAMNGGTSGVTDLGGDGEIKKLSAGIAGLLGDGSDTL